MANNGQAPLGQQDKGRVIKWFALCNGWDVSALEPTLKVWFYVVINRSQRNQSLI